MPVAAPHLPGVRGRAARPARDHDGAAEDDRRASGRHRRTRVRSTSPTRGCVACPPPRGRARPWARPDPPARSCARRDGPGADRRSSGSRGARCAVQGARSSDGERHRPPCGRPRCGRAQPSGGHARGDGPRPGRVLAAEAGSQRPRSRAAPVPRRLRCRSTGSAGRSSPPPHSRIPGMAGSPRAMIRSATSSVTSSSASPRKASVMCHCDAGCHRSDCGGRHPAHGLEGVAQVLDRCAHRAGSRRTGSCGPDVPPAEDQDSAGEQQDRERGGAARRSPRRGRSRAG